METMLSNDSENERKNHTKNTMTASFRGKKCRDNKQKKNHTQTQNTGTDNQTDRQTHSHTLQIHT